MRPYLAAAYLVALGVMVQAGAIALGVFGIGPWVESGGVLDKAALESEGGLYPEDVGFTIHSLWGTFGIPALSLALLIIAFFARVPGGVKRAGVVVGLVVAQVLLGMFAHSLPMLGVLHGLNAFLVFSAALWAGLRAQRAWEAGHGLEFGLASRRLAG